MVQSLRLERPQAVSSGSPMLITNALLPGHPDLMRLWIKSDGTIQSIETMAQSFKQPPPESLQIINLEADWLSLGGVDLQVNGGLGLAFPDLSSQNQRQLLQVCQALWEEGIDAFLPTIVTSSIAQIQEALAAIAAYQKKHGNATNSAKILGVHLEGPFLNAAKRGAHAQAHLQPLTLETVKAVIGDYAPLIKIITLAPELDTTGTVIPYLRSLGILVSLGHSQATEAEAQQAFQQGATLVTHAFNAMPSLHHREAGLLGAALVQEGVYSGLIADGVHVCPTMLKILLRAGGFSERLFLVSDALAPAGLPDGAYPWDERQIEVKSGTARLQNGTLAGTTLSLLAGVQNLVHWEICSVDEAIALATIAPRRALGESGEGPKRDRLYIGHSMRELLRWRYERGQNQLTWQRLEVAT
ncbi:MAG: N-acetylglucosamine-6-phosphate deacetylase [Cyanobacteria bacterium P01_H01_bin.121]